jgi:hypothetical protein
VIVWSKGLGKQRLPLELPAAKLRASADFLVLEGVIEPVCWNYAIRLAPSDLNDFLKLMSQPKTAQFLAERSGVLWPFLSGLIAIVPRLLFKLLFADKRSASPPG